jgi:hypothetical protein
MNPVAIRTETVHKSTEAAKARDATGKSAGTLSVRKPELGAQSP